MIWLGLIDIPLTLQSKLCRLVRSPHLMLAFIQVSQGSGTSLVSILCATYLLNSRSIASLLQGTVHVWLSRRARESRQYNRTRFLYYQARMAVAEVS